LSLAAGFGFGLDLVLVFGMAKRFLERGFSEVVTF